MLIREYEIWGRISRVQHDVMASGILGNNAYFLVNHIQKQIA